MVSRMAEDSLDRQERLHAFLEQFWKDQDKGQVQPLEIYLSLFPGDAEAIASEYLALKRQAAAGDHAGTWPHRIGPYQILRELGRGGQQATVYLAEDTSLGRKVALKVLDVMGPAQDEVLARFRREALAASRLQHPGICSVYEAKVDSKVPYIAMQYIEGETLAKRIATTRERLSPTTAGDFGDST
jgi:serine/threonine protein kinase